VAYNHPPKLTDTFQRLAGKVVLVTGASSGVGAAACRLFAAEGARVVCVARRIEVIEELVHKLKTAGLEATAAPCDVTDEQSVAAAVQTTLDSYGRLDCAFNNAGHGSVRGPVTRGPLQCWRCVTRLGKWPERLAIQVYVEQILAFRQPVQAKRNPTRHNRRLKITGVMPISA
jgi:NAD(P)-dependent dehydrogenase (short-subunit alcohol dehydrogenase family)